MDEDALKILQETRDKMHRCREKYFWSQFTSYGWSFAGNIVSAFAAFKANTSPRLFTLLYILKHFVWFYVWFYRQKSLEEIEKEINSLYNDSMKKVREVYPKYPMHKVRTVTFNISSHPQLTLAVPFVSFLWDLTKRVYRKNLSTRNYDVLDKALMVLSDLVKRRKYEIEQLIPTLKEIKPLLQGSPCKVVTALPGVVIPAKVSTKEAILNECIEIQNIPVYCRDVLKSARSCLQAREEAKVLPTIRLAKNHKRLEDAYKNLDAIKKFKTEFQRLDYEKQKNQQAIVEGIATMLDNTTEALDKVFAFDMDIRSELKKSTIEKSVILVTEFAKEGYAINHQVEKAVNAMKDIKDSSKGRFSILFGLFRRVMKILKINKIKKPVGTEKDWSTESKELADSVKLLGEHVEKFKLKLNSLNDMMNEIYASYRTENMTKNAKVLAREALSIVDQKENSKGQIGVLEQVLFQSIWPSNTETVKMQIDATNKMRSKAKILRLKVIAHKSLSYKLSAALHSVDKMSLVIAIFGTAVEVFKIYMLFQMHPKEILIKNMIEEISGEI